MLLYTPGWLLNSIPSSQWHPSPKSGSHSHGIMGVVILGTQVQGWISPAHSLLFIPIVTVTDTSAYYLEEDLAERKCYQPQMQECILFPLGEEFTTIPRSSWTRHGIIYRLTHEGANMGRKPWFNLAPWREPGGAYTVGSGGKAGWRRAVSDLVLTWALPTHVQMHYVQTVHGFSAFYLQEVLRPPLVRI